MLVGLWATQFGLSNKHDDAEDLVVTQNHQPNTPHCTHPHQPLIGGRLKVLPAADGVASVGRIGLNDGGEGSTMMIPTTTTTIETGAAAGIDSIITRDRPARHLLGDLVGLPVSP